MWNVIYCAGCWVFVLLIVAIGEAFAVAFDWIFDEIRRWRRRRDRDRRRRSPAYREHVRRLLAEEQQKWFR